MTESIFLPSNAKTSRAFFSSLSVHSICPFIFLDIYVLACLLSGHIALAISVLLIDFSSLMKVNASNMIAKLKNKIKLFYNNSCILQQKLYISGVIRWYSLQHIPYNNSPVRKASTTIADFMGLIVFNSYTL